MPLELVHLVGEIQIKDHKDLLENEGVFGLSDSTIHLTLEL